MLNKIAYFFIQNSIETEQKNNCFICDLPSFDFERRAKVSIEKEFI